MLVACRIYHSVTAWVALVKFRKVHTVPLALHCGREERVLKTKPLPREAQEGSIALCQLPRGFTPQLESVLES